MPHKLDILPALYEHHPWLEAIDDGCLFQLVVESLVARSFAVRQGADDHIECRKALTSADRTLDQIAEARVGGELACRKGADALRKYTIAAECSQPTARKRNGRRTVRGA